MSVSREEIEKIVNSFDKIANRSEKKTSTSNKKLLIFISCIVLVIIIILGVLYYRKQGKTKSGKGSLESGNGNASSEKQENIKVVI